MSDWKAKLPKDSAPRGQAHAVLSYKTQGGFRVELAGVITLQRARLLQRVMSLSEDELQSTYIHLNISATIRERKEQSRGDEE
jgi:hypothetical protein